MENPNISSYGCEKFLPKMDYLVLLAKTLGVSPAILRELQQINDKSSYNPTLRSTLLKRLGISGEQLKVIITQIENLGQLNSQDELE